MNVNKNKGQAKKGPVPVANGKNNGKNGKLQPLKNNERLGSPSIRGANKKVVPNIKDDKTREKEQAALMSSILSGRYTTLPPKRPTEVRVFLSSTFSDMREERNTLMRRANPELREYCFEEHGLDFSMVDMRWGVTDEATNDHSTEEICLREIHNCQRVGLGPNFVTILGDRYGYRPIPKTIDVSEMEGVIVPEVSDKGRVELLYKWYKRDDNAVPPQYVLQPVTCYLPEFGTGGAADSQWYTEQEQLGETLRGAMFRAQEHGKATATRQHDYNMSVTESEIWHGILKAEKPDLHCLFFLRRFKNLNDEALNEEKTAAKRYIDNIKTADKTFAIDEEVEKMRQNLHTTLIPKHLTGSNIYKYPPLEWAPKGVTPDESHEDHKNYIENFCKDFTVGLKTMIEKDKSQMHMHTAKNMYYSNFDEILHHVHFVQAKVATFRGQEDTLKEVKEHMESGKRVPFVIYAESGGGKTSIMAKIYDSLSGWFGKDVHRVIRFLGTTPLSTALYDVLWSVTGQIADNFKVIVQPSCSKTLKGLVAFLPRLLRTTLKKEKNERLVILLDSIDQLSGENDAFKMKWLPKDLPANVHIIISTIPTLHGILDNCRKIGLPPSAMREVTALNETEGREIVTAYLEKTSRKIQAEQATAIMEAYNQVKNVLYLKLLMDKAVTWQSYTKVDHLMKDIGTSVRAAINHLFGTLETKFGKVLICRTLGYITVGLSGLTNVELEDALSCDNEVLDKVYQYHPPPVEGIIRLPPVLWPRIKYDLEEYLTERNSQGKNTLFWYHRQFIEAAKDRYAGDGGMGNMLHRNLADLFLAEDGVKKTVTLTSPRIKKTIENADRQVAKHPITSNNKRSLVAACYHFQNSEDTEGMKSNIFFNYRFLLAKIQSEGVGSILDEISHLLKALNAKSALEYHYDLEMLRACLFDFETEERNHLKVRNQILCCIPKVEWLPMSGKMQAEALEEVVKQQEKLTPVLLPLHPFLFYKANMADIRENVPEVVSCQRDSLCCKPAKPDPKNWYHDVFNIGKPKLLKMTYHSIYGLCCPSSNTGDCYVFRSGTYYNAKSYKHPHINVYRNIYRLNAKGELFNNSSGITLQVDMFDHTEANPTCRLEAASLSSHEEVFLFQLGKDIIALKGATEEKKKFAITYKMYSKTEGSPKMKSDETHLALGVQGTEVEIKQMMHSDVNDKTMILLHSRSDDGSDLTTLTVPSYKDSKVHKASLNLPGKPYPGTMQLTSDEATLIFAIESNNGSGHKIYRYFLEKNKCSSFSIDGKVKALSYTCIGPVIWYALTENKIIGYDCETEAQCFSMSFDRGSLATAFRVEDDGEFIYVGDSEGKVHAWQVDCKYYLGYVEFHHGSITGIYMSHADVNIIIHTEEKVLLSIPQRHFIDQCVRTMEGDKHKNHNAPSDELDKLRMTENILICETGTWGTVLATIEPESCKLWDIGTLKKVKEVTYGEDCGRLESCQVLHDNKQHYLMYNATKALLLDTNSFRFSLIPDVTDILAVTQSSRGFWILTRRDENKVDLKLINQGSQSMTSTFRVKEQLNSEMFELMVTASEKYILVKAKCSEKELEIIEASEKKTNGAAELAGDFKFYAVDVSKEMEEVTLIPCLKNLSKVLCLAQTCVPYHDNTVLIVLKKSINFWDIDAKKNLPRLVKGKNMPMFELISNDKMTDADRHSITDVKYHLERKVLLAISVRDKYENENQKWREGGRVDVFRESGEHVTPNWWKSKPNNMDDVLERLAVSHEGSYAVTTSKANVLKCWHVTNNYVKETSCLQLDVTVMHISFDHSGKYVALLGKGDQRTKVMVFKVKL